MISKDIFTAVDEDEFDFVSADIETYDEMRFNPVGVHISDDTIVDVIQNAQVIKSGRWDSIVAWFNDNYHELNGNFDISHRGAVLYTAKLSS